jgi:hypothetical protein
VLRKKIRPQKTIGQSGIASWRWHVSKDLKVVREQAADSWKRITPQRVQPVLRLLRWSRLAMIKED